MKLTRKQQLFVEAYRGQARGNATEAARLAGYKGNDVVLAQVGAENLKKPQIAEAIAEADAASPAVASADTLLEIWTRWVTDPDSPITKQVEGAKLLAKCKGMQLRDRPVRVPLPEVTDASSVLEASRAVVVAVARGDITPAEGVVVNRVLDGTRAAIETVELERRIAALEDSQSAEA